MTRNRTGWLVLLSSMSLTLLAAGCSGSSKPKPGPTLASLTPATGTISTTITISGSNIGGSTGNPPTVTFTPSQGGSGYAAQVTAVSDTSLDAIVPAVAAEVAADGTAFDVTVANPGGGTTTAYRAFTMTAPVVSDVNGGLAGSGSPNSPFIVDGANFGDLHAQTSGYSVDFRDAGTDAVVASTTVAYESGDWTNVYVVGTVPGSLATGTTYHVTVTTPSGTSAARDFLVLGGVPFSPSQIQWTATASLPVAQQGFSSAVAAIGTTSFVYAFGGNVATASTANGKASNVSAVYLDALDGSTGALANPSWTSTAPLPEPRAFTAAVVADSFNSLVPGNGQVYVLGGLDGTGTPAATVYHASLNADGTVPAARSDGTWAETTALPEALFGAGAVLFHGRIYVAGGNDSTGTPVAKAWSAKIEGDGSLDAWEALPDLPAALAYHQLVMFAGNLYVLGGDTAAVDPVTNVTSDSSQAYVYYQPIDIRNGKAGNPTWVVNAAQMSKAREKFTAVVAGGYVLVSGGLYAGDAPNPSSEQSYAQFNQDGSLGAAMGATGVHTVYNASGGTDDFYNHAAAYFVDASGTPHVLLLGGGDVNTGAVHAEVWYQH